MREILFGKYVKEVEPSKYKKSCAWKTAIGLQEVDALKPSCYLLETAKKSIEGDITFEEAQDLINSYYEEKEDADIKTEEADKVSVRIAKIISEKAFVFSMVEYISIHKKLFDGIFDHAGTLRKKNITKKEWVLEGDTVIYGDAYSLKATIEYDIEREKSFNYSGLDVYEIIAHISRFIADLWQIHPFYEGNTRTSAVFLIKYLNKLGFEVTNDTFQKNAWYFRNALVRANYENVVKGIDRTSEYIELFLRNLLLGEKNVLSNKSLHISYESSYNYSQTELRIIDILKENGHITLEELADKIGKSLRTTKEIIKRLKENRIVERIGSKKIGHWKVIKFDKTKR